ncbi:hypothetical protein QE418_001149 [Microbacterium testaceum]|nr:hypothetical protein [Microbacterium testaceum]MDR6097760.1 hypothetical protein [Microbacterium sp. SORGH_AS_0454]
MKGQRPFPARRPAGVKATVQVTFKPFNTVSLQVRSVVVRRTDGETEGSLRTVVRRAAPRPPASTPRMGGKGTRRAPPSPHRPYVAIDVLSAHGEGAAADVVDRLSAFRRATPRGPPAWSRSGADLPAGARRVLGRLASPWLGAHRPARATRSSRNRRTAPESDAGTRSLRFCCVRPTLLREPPALGLRPPAPPAAPARGCAPRPRGSPRALRTTPATSGRRRAGRSRRS